MRLLFIIGVVVLTVTSYDAQSDCIQTTGTIFNTTSETVNLIRRLSNQFSLEMYKTLSMLEEQDFSIPGYPFFRIMTMMFLNSAGETRNKLAEFLNFPKNYNELFLNFPIIDHEIKQPECNYKMETKMNYKTETKKNHKTETKKNHKTETEMDAVVTSNTTTKSNYQRSEKKAKEAKPVDTKQRKPVTSDNSSEKFYAKSKFQCYVSAQTSASESNQTSEVTDEPEETKNLTMMGKYRYGRLDEVNATFVQIPCMEHKADSSKNNESEMDGPKNESVSVFYIYPDDPEDFEHLEKHIDKVNVTKLSAGTEETVNLTVPAETYTYSSHDGAEFSRMFLETPLGQLFFRNESHNSTDVLDSSFGELQPWIIGVYAVEMSRQEYQDEPTLDHVNVIQVNINCPFISIVIINPENPIIFLMTRSIDLH